MNYNTNRIPISKRQEIQTQQSAADQETYVKQPIYKIQSSHMNRNIHSGRHYDRPKHLSITKVKQQNFQKSDPMSHLKNQLYNLKLDFSSFFNEEPQRYSEPHLKIKPTVSKSPHYEEDQRIGHPKYNYAHDIINGVQLIQQENISLKNQVQSLKHRYETKKQEFSEAVRFLNKKIQFLEEQLQSNEQSMLQCKNQLERQMDLIRQQLMRKKNAEISLQDYGQILQINSNLKEEINCHLNSMDLMKNQLEEQYRKFGELQKENNMLAQTNKQILQQKKQQSLQKCGLEKQNQQLSASLFASRRQIKQLAEKSQSYNRQIQTNNESIFKQIDCFREQISILQNKLRAFEQQNTYLRTKQMEYMITIGELNSQILLLRTQNQTRISQPKQDYQNKLQEIKYFKGINDTQKQEIQNMKTIISQFQNQKTKLEDQRGAMLSDIMYIEAELQRRGHQTVFLRGVISQKQNQIHLLKKSLNQSPSVQNIQNVSIGASQTVFVQSEQVSSQITKQFSGLLDSPEANHAQISSFSMAPDIEFIQDFQVYPYEFNVCGDINQNKRASSVFEDENLIQSPRNTQLISRLQNNTKVVQSIISQNNQSLTQNNLIQSLQGQIHIENLSADQNQM